MHSRLSLRHRHLPLLAGDGSCSRVLFLYFRVLEPSAVVALRVADVLGRRRWGFLELLRAAIGSSTSIIASTTDPFLSCNPIPSLVIIGFVCGFV